MKTTAIVCELNPLHHGHRYLLEKARADADCVIAVMSGNFVQRGEVAILDKYERARLALLAGADLVVELPLPFAIASAEYFAAASTAIAEMLGADTLLFGCGTGDRALLGDISREIATPSFAFAVAEERTKSPALGEAQIREICLKRKFGDEAAHILRSPNDILAIEYGKAICLSGYRIVPCGIPRLTAEDDPRFLGATAIRSRIEDEGVASVEPHVPAFVFDALTSAVAAGELGEFARYLQIAFSRLRCDFRENVSVAEGEDGLFLRIKAAAAESTSPAEMLIRAATKKYTNARIRRVLLNYLLDITESDLKALPAVTTLLAATGVGRKYLSLIRKTCPLSILTKPADYRQLSPVLQHQYAHTMRGDALYTLCRSRTEPADLFLKKHPYMG